MDHPTDMPTPATPRREHTHRLFFALWPGADVRSAIARAATRLGPDADGHVTAPESYHLTVLFLGDFRPLPEAVLSAAMGAGASIRMDPFELSLDRAGVFPGSWVLWLGPEVMPAGLLALHEGLMQALVSQLSLRAEPAFVPHVTIRRHARATESQRAQPVVHWPVRDFVLIDSQPGTPYRILGQWPLRTR
jgi:2'-5' RNA ligase